MSIAGKFMRKLVVALVGFPLLILGIILIPLPGPGVLVSLMAFFVLSLEFEWADKGMQGAKNTIRQIYKAAKDQASKIDPSLK